MTQDLMRERQQLQQYLAQKNIPMATRLCEKLVHQLPQDQQLWLLLMQLYLSANQFDKSNQVRRQLAKHLPQSSEIHKSTALIYQQFGRFKIAIDELKLAISTKPSDYTLYPALGALLIHTRRYKEAIDALDNALRHGCRTSQINLMLGAAHNSLQDTNAALKHFSRARELDPNNLDAAVGVADIHFLRREYDEANAILSPMMELAAPPVAAVLVYAKLSPSINQQQHAIEKLKHTLSNCKYSDSQQSKLYFALGKLSDEQQDYDAAFNYYYQGNELEQHVYIKKNVEEFFDSIIRTFDSEFIRSKQRSSTGGERLVFIVGMPRSGSSLTEQILASHPEVFGAGELQTLGSIVKSLPVEHGLAGSFPHYCKVLSEKIVNAGAEQYLDYIRGLDNRSALVTDKMPNNFLYLGLINIFFPEAKIIHCIRNIYDTCLSCYFQQFSGHYPYAYKLENLGHYYGCYQKLMSHWNHVLSVPVFDLRYEELVKDSRETVQSLLSHCDLEWDNRCLEFYKSNRAITTASTQQASRPLYDTSLNRFLRYEKHLGPLRRQLKAVGL